MLITDIKGAVRRKWDYTISASTFAALVAAAVREYSRWNPRVAETTLTTVADQQYYDLPSGCMGVKKALYYPVGQPYSEIRASQEIVHVLRQPARYLLPSQRVIDDINEDAHIASLEGEWEFLPGQNQLVITPEPETSGTEIEVTYYLPHLINGAGDAYETILDADMEIMAKLVLAEILEGELMEVAVQPDYAEGLERETFRFVPPNLAQVISDLRQSVRFKYGSAAAAVSPP